MDWVRIEDAAFWICFVAVFLAIAVWESVNPKTTLSIPAERRWRNHGTLLAITVVISSVTLRMSPLVVAAVTAGSNFGLLNKPWLPFSVRCVLTVVLLDLLQYWIHWSFHRVSWLWRVHEVHHSDPDYDVSTAGRFHPLEVVFSNGLRLGAVALLAPPVLGVLIAEVLTAVLNLSVHANASLPRPLESLVGAIFVTPDLHRVHHSEDYAEQQRNLGQTFPWWDRMFGTYTSSERSAAAGFQTGLKGSGPEGRRNADRLSLGFMLAEPFHPVATPAALNGAEGPERAPEPLA